MSDIFRLMLAQLNPVVGDIAGNIAKAREAWAAGRAAGADMVALTEMFVTGYQTQDLILKPAFVVVCAFLFSEHARQPEIPGNLFAILLMGVVVALLIAQPDLGRRRSGICGQAT